MDSTTQVNDGAPFDISVYGKPNCTSMLASATRIPPPMTNGSAAETPAIRWLITLPLCTSCLPSFTPLSAAKSCEFVGNSLKIWSIFFNAWEMAIS
ncbi:Uncharacterised protein [Shigella sonnei]|nr:Uncharacterised protein [Shigella sonnei]CSQ66433.1 Uncharacterised protein [Shigella sonnei]